MKSYREIADSVFARRDQYIIQQRKKKQTITRVTASVGSVALVSLKASDLATMVPNQVLVPIRA